MSPETTLAPPRLAGLPPVVDARSRVLILGSFPSVLALRKREYYGNPQNQFWAVMERLFGVDRRRPYEQRLEVLLQRGLGIWDVIESCYRQGSGDDAIEHAQANRLARLLEANPQIKHIAFNGTMAWQTARRQLPRLFDDGRRHVQRMPSTSTKNARMSLEGKVRAWSGIKQWLADPASQL